MKIIQGKNSVFFILIGKKLSFFHSYREKTQFFPCKNSSTANHEMQKKPKTPKIAIKLLFYSYFFVFSDRKKYIFISFLFLKTGLHKNI